MYNSTFSTHCQRIFYFLCVDNAFSKCYTLVIP
nr:MAG TPA: hypothetical protein [Caudoviricetes sp.]